MPAGFKEVYRLVQVITDCTELKVQSPSGLTLNSETYSRYKGSAKWKGLVSIAQLRVIIPLSLLYSDCISYKHLTKASGVLELLEPGYQVMVAKGFLVELAVIECSLVILNFLAAKGQISVNEVSGNEATAHLYSHTFALLLVYFLGHSPVECIIMYSAIFSPFGLFHLNFFTDLLSFLGFRYL